MDEQTYLHSRTLRVALLLSLVTLIVIASLWCSMAHANPFLVSDPVAGCPTTVAGDTHCPTSFAISLDAGAVVSSPAKTDGSLYYDMGSAPTGSHALSMKAVNVWGQSSALNFPFSKSFPDPPANPRLNAQ